MTNKHTTTLFKPRHENLNLLIPLVFFALAIYEIASGLTFGSLPSLLLRQLVGFVFLNSLHIAFTFIMLFNLPQIKEWVKLEQGGLKVFIFKLSIIYILTYFFMLTALGVLVDFNSQARIYFYSTYLILYQFIFSRHALKQSYGLTMCYDGDRKDEKSFLLEKKLLSFFVGFLLISLLIADWNNLKTSYAIPKFIFYVSYLIALGCLISFLIRLFINRTHRNKLIFTVRFFLWALLPFSILSLLGVRATHGSEYYFTCKKMVTKSLGENLSLLKLSGGFLILAFALIPALLSVHSGIPAFFYNSQFTAPSIWRHTTALTFSFGLMHFYVDHLLFKMRNPVTRRLIGPLL